MSIQAAIILQDARNHLKYAELQLAGLPPLVRKNSEVENAEIAIADADAALNRLAGLIDAYDTTTPDP
jgi:hypothetical protein